MKRSSADDDDEYRTHKRQRTEKTRLVALTTDNYMDYKNQWLAERIVYGKAGDEQVHDRHWDPLESVPEPPEIPTYDALYRQLSVAKLRSEHEKQIDKLLSQLRYAVDTPPSITNYRDPARPTAAAEVKRIEGEMAAAATSFQTPGTSSNSPPSSNNLDDYTAWRRQDLVSDTARYEANMKSWVTEVRDYGKDRNDLLLRLINSTSESVKTLMGEDYRQAMENKDSLQFWRLQERSCAPSTMAKTARVFDEFRAVQQRPNEHPDSYFARVENAAAEARRHKHVIDDASMIHQAISHLVVKSDLQGIYDQAHPQASPKTTPSTSPPTKKQRKEMLLMEKLINAVFVDKKRVITVEDGCDIWSLPEDGQVFWDGFSTNRLVIHSQWLQLYEQLINGARTLVLLKGKAGRGKSAFLRYMIIRMLEDAAIPNEATFAYVVKDSIGTSRTFWIAKAGVSVDVMERITEEPTYLLLDNVDSALNMRGVKLNLGLTSGDKEALKEFRKRVAEHKMSGKYLTMQALDLKTMKLMFPALSPDDLQFRFDVLGGNPRRFLDEEPDSVSQEIEQLVYKELQNCILMFFGVTYDHKKKSVAGLRARWAMRMIANEVQQSADCDSSLFRAEFTTDGRCQERFASSFLRLVAGALDSKNDASLKEALKKIVGSSGLGYAHEYLSHAAFLAGDPATITFGLDTAQAIVQLPAGLYGRAVTLVRNIPDLKNLRGCTTYGLPTVSNFPAVDAIVSPNLLQMTISDKHGGAVDKLSDIATSLGVAVADLLLIFVVESVEKAWDFKFPVIQGVRMVVSPREVCTEQALRTGH